MKFQETVVVGGKSITFEAGQLARQAHGAVVVRHEGTFILATVVADEGERARGDFLPLTVEFREKLAAGGRIPGAYGKREGRTADHEVLTSRLVDRSLRPMIDKGFNAETLVNVTLYGVDARSDVDSLAILAASAAVYVSDLPMATPVAGLRVATKGGATVLFPSEAERDGADLELVLAGTREGLVMVEGGALEVARADVVAALAAGQAALGPLLDVMESLRRAVGKPRRVVEAPPEPPAALVAALDARLLPTMEAAYLAPKAARRAMIAEAGRAAVQALGPEHPDVDVGALVEARWRGHIRARTLAGTRIGGRPLDVVRDISGEVRLVPTNHGSALFSRGETQALVSVTLGSPDDALQWETALGKVRDRFMLHYNFPSFSVGEVKGHRGGPGRREIGHGALARRALAAVLPPEEELPSTVRVVSDILESNGSSSMATVCGGSLALMDAGVPITRAVGGIAMGLVREGERVAVLSDILGDEDHLGDMDFKVAGTRRGVTAFQLDNKLGAVAPTVLERALEQALAGLHHILGEMDKILSEPRPELAAGAPQTATTRVPTARIGTLIGQGGKTIQELQSSTHTRIEVKDDGRVRVTGKRMADVKAALARIEALTGELELHKVYRAEVVSIKDFGCFVKVGDHEGLVHVSELAATRVDKVSDVVKVGDQVEVKVLGADERGRLKLSRKAALK